MSSIIENSADQWERLDKNDNSEEELRIKFQEHPAYAAMYERFSDAKEEITYYGRGNGNMRDGTSCRFSYECEFGDRRNS